MIWFSLKSNGLWKVWIYMVISMQTNDFKHMFYHHSLGRLHSHTSWKQLAILTNSSYHGSFHLRILIYKDDSMCVLSLSKTLIENYIRNFYN
jgi:hypothetical protein